MIRVAVALCFLTAALSMGAAAPSSAAPSKWCSENGDSPPCVQSAKRDGGPPITDSTDPNWGVDFLVVSPGHVMATVFNKAAGSEDLGSAELSHQWAVTIHVGTTVPRLVFATGDNVTVDRGAGPDYHVTVTGTPVTETQGCDQSSWPWSCPDPPTDQFDAIFSAEITDYHEWQDVVQRNSMYGMNYWTNADAKDVPPQFGPDPGTGLNRIVLELANSHHYQDGTTVFTGFAHLRIPNSFLTTVYGIDNPATLTSAGIVPSGAGPSASVSIAEGDGNTALFVDITGMTFSARRVTLNRGLITPTRPTSPRATRTATHRGRLSFTPSKPRGSRITGYRARCVSGSSAVSAVRASPPIVVTGLLKDRAYQCRIRARSKAGLGAWSVSVTMPRHP